MRKWVFVLAILMVSLVHAQDFDLDNLLLKVSLNQGASLSKGIQITGSPGETFVVEQFHLNGVSVDEELFDLESDVKTVGVDFDSGEIEPGVQVGRIKVASTERLVLVPVIFEVESEDVFYDVVLDIPPEYTDIHAGDNFVVDLNIFSLVGGDLGQKTVRMSYFIADFYGNKYLEESEDLVVDNQVSVTKNFVIPANLAPGSYVFSASANYESSVGSSSHAIVVLDDSLRSSPLFQNIGTSEVLFFSLLGFILVLFVVVLVIFIYIIRQRDKLILKRVKHN